MELKEENRVEGKVAYYTFIKKMCVHDLVLRVKGKSVNRKEKQVKSRGSVNSKKVKNKKLFSVSENCNYEYNESCGNN